jgi:hypothetical protein
MLTNTTAPAAGAIDKSRYLEPSPYEADGGHLIGRLPRDVGLELLQALPAPRSPIKAIRAKCIDCCCYQQSEVRKCVAVKCPLWPYRMGSSPYHARSSVAQNTAGLEGGFSDAAAIPASEVL